MSKGGGVDTSGMQGAAVQERQLAQQAAALAGQNWTQGQGMYTGYEKPVLDQYLKILGLGPGGQSQYTDPALNMLMQPVLQQGSQAADAAKKNLMSSGLGPVATATGAQQIDLAKMANTQSGALQQVMTMLGQLVGAGQQGTNLQASAPGQIVGAASAVGQSGQLEGMIAQMQYKAQQDQNMGLSQGLQGIMQLGGMLGGGFLAGPAGATVGGMLGGSAPFSSANTGSNYSGPTRMEYF